MAKNIVLKAFINKRNGQISLHPKKKDLSKKILLGLRDGKKLKIGTLEII